MNNKIAHEFFEDVARSLDYWTDEGVAALSNGQQNLSWSEHSESFRRLQAALAKVDLPPSDIRNALAEILRGFAVSVFTTIDGGTEFAENHRVNLVDESGVSLGELHDEFISHLVRSGRL